MELTRRPFLTEDDFWRVRNFLREVFLLNGRLEYSWHVARLDYLRWHMIENCQACGPIDQVMSIWETPDCKIAAVLHPICHDEIRMHVHPRLRTPEIEDEIIAYAEEHYSDTNRDGQRILTIPTFSDDTLRQQVLIKRGVEHRPGWGHHWRRDLHSPIPETSIPYGYEIRSMGTEKELPSRSWASWRAFHSDEPDENYDGDYSWFRNIQSAPLYRRDLDIVAVTQEGEVASFCTIYYDDYTRSAVTVLVGTAAEHWQRGLGKAVIFEGMQRLKRMGCTRVFSTATEEPADALYRSVMHDMKETDTWIKTW